MSELNKIVQLLASAVADKSNTYRDFIQAEHLEHIKNEIINTQSIIRSPNKSYALRILDILLQHYGFGFVKETLLVSSFEDPNLLPFIIGSIPDYHGSSFDLTIAGPASSILVSLLKLGQHFGKPLETHVNTIFTKLIHFIHRWKDVHSSQIFRAIEALLIIVQHINTFPTTDLGLLTGDLISFLFTVPRGLVLTKSQSVIDLLTLLALISRYTRLQISADILNAFLRFLQEFLFRFSDDATYDLIIRIWVGYRFFGYPYRIGGYHDLSNQSVFIIGLSEVRNRYAHLLPLNRKLASLDYVRQQVKTLYPHIKDDFTLTYEGFFSQIIEVKDDATLLDALRFRPHGVRFTIHHSYQSPTHFTPRNLLSIYNSRIPPLDSKIQTYIRTLGRELTFAEFHNAYTLFLKTQNKGEPSVQFTSFLFDIFDQDNNNHISEEEFLEGVQLYYHQQVEEELERIFNHCAERGRDYISEEGFIRSIQETRNHKSLPFTNEDIARAKEIFKKIDINGDGHLQFYEYRLAILTNKLFAEGTEGRVANI